MKHLITALAVLFSSVTAFAADVVVNPTLTQEQIAQNIIKDLSFKALCLSGYVKTMAGWKQYPNPSDACLKHLQPADLTDYQGVRRIVVDIEKWIWVLNEHTGMKTGMSKLAADFSYHDGVATTRYNNILSNRTVTWKGVNKTLAQHLIYIVDPNNSGFDRNNLPVMDYGAFFISFLHQYRKDFSGRLSYPKYWATKCPAFNTATTFLEENKALTACTTSNSNEEQVSFDRKTASFVMEFLARALQLPNAKQYLAQYSHPSNLRQVQAMVTNAYTFINNSCSPYNPEATQDYTNMFLLSTSAEFALGRFFESLGTVIQVDRSHVAAGCSLPNFYTNNSTDLATEARYLFNLWYERTVRNGISEVMAPNYYPVDLRALELLFHSFSDPTMRAKVRKIQSLLYAHLLLGWTPSYQSFNSALGRTYDFNTNSGFDNSGLESIKEDLKPYFILPATTHPVPSNYWEQASQGPYAPFTVSPEMAFGYNDQLDLLTELASVMKRTNRSVQVQYGPTGNHNIKTFIGEEISLSSLGQSRGHEDVPVVINVKEMNQGRENGYTGAYFLMDLSNDPLMTDDRAKLRSHLGKEKPNHLIPDIQRYQRRNLLAMTASVSSNSSQMADFAAAGGCRNRVNPKFADCHYLNGLYAHFVIPIRDKHLSVDGSSFAGKFNIYEAGQTLDSGRTKKLLEGHPISFDDSKVLHFAFSKAAIGLNILGVKNIFGNSTHEAWIKFHRHPTLSCIKINATDCDNATQSKLSFFVVTIRLGKKENLFDAQGFLKSDIKRPTISYILNTIRLDPSVSQAELIQANNVFLSQELAPDVVLTHGSANTTTNLNFKFNGRNLSLQQTASQTDFAIVQEESSEDPTICQLRDRGILCSDIRNDEEQTRDLSPYFRSR